MSTEAAPSSTTGSPMPHPRMRDLEFFVGEWEAPGRFHATPFGPAKDIEMHLSGKYDNRGFWFELLTTELATPSNSAPLTARYVWGYDVISEELVADWFDSNGGRGVQRSTGWHEGILEFSGTMTMQGTTIPLRDTFTKRGPDAYHHIGAVDLGTGWIPVDEEEAVRRTRQP